jgi:hypothetical protein
MGDQNPLGRRFAVTTEHEKAEMKTELLHGDLITIQRNLRQMRATLLRCIPKRVGQNECYIVMYLLPWE